MTQHIFVSYASEDRDRISPLVSLLEQARSKRRWNVNIWWDRTALRGGQLWHDEIRNAISNSRVALACVSTRSAAKIGYLQQELLFIVDCVRERGSANIALIPVRLDDCILLSLFAHIHALDYFDERGPQTLLEAIDNALREPENQSIAEFDAPLKELEQFLTIGEFKAADECTTSLCSLLIRRVPTEGPVHGAYCAVLATIDRLWQEASEGAFGFGRQAIFWLPPQTPRDVNQSFSRLGDAVGWRLDGEWIYEYDGLTFAADAAQGHLPSLRSPEDERETFWCELWRTRVTKVRSILTRCAPPTGPAA